MNSDIEDIKSRLNIVDVVGEYVKLTKAGSNWKGICPFHNEKSPSFMVHEEKQIYHCFGCAKGGDVYNFVMEMESVEFKEALTMLAEKAGVQLSSYKSERRDDKKILQEILELATRFYETQLWKGAGKDRILPYLHGRGLTDDSIRNFRLGYAPAGWRNISNFLTERGYKSEDIVKTGLLVTKAADNDLASNEGSARTYDRFRDRIMFPISDAMGKVIGYSARVAPGADETQAKYVNTPETVLYHKSNALYGLDRAKQAIKQKEFVLLVEGNMDVIAAHQAGIANTVAVSGTALTSQQVDILKRYAPSVKMMFDMDSAGQAAAERSIDLCFQKDVNAQVVSLADGKDAADAVQKDLKILVDAVSNSVHAMDYLMEKTVASQDVGSSEGKKMAARIILSHVRHMTDSIERSHWIKKVAQRLDVEEKDVASVLQAVSKSDNVRQGPKVVEKSTEQQTFRKRSDLIAEQIAGILMSHVPSWKEIAEKRQEKSTLRSNKLLAYVLDRGVQAGYSFDALLLKAENDAVRKRLQQVCFKERYKFDIQGGVFELDGDKALEFLDQYIREYDKELQKERRDSIMKNIRSAQERGDVEELNSLMREFAELSQQLNK